VVPFRFVSVRTVSIAAAVAIFVLGFLFIYRSHEPEKIFVDDKKENGIIQEKPSVAENKASDLNDDKTNPKITPSPVVINEKKSDQTNTPSRPNHEKKKRHDSKSSGPLFTDNKKVNVSPQERDSLKNVQPITLPEKTEEPIAEHKEDKVVRPKTKSIELADIFDESDIKELQNNSAQKEAPVQNFALKEVERISGVKVKTKKTEESTTFAFSVKRVFSIEHSSANR